MNLILAENLLNDVQTALNFGTLISLVLAVALGAVVGLERERTHKPALVVLCVTSETKATMPADRLPFSVYLLKSQPESVSEIG